MRINSTGYQFRIFHLTFQKAFPHIDKDAAILKIPNTVQINGQDHDIKPTPNEFILLIWMRKKIKGGSVFILPGCWCISECLEKKRWKAFFFGWKKRDHREPKALILQMVEHLDLLEASNPSPKWAPEVVEAYFPDTSSEESQSSQRLGLDLSNPSLRFESSEGDTKNGWEIEAKRFRH